MTPIERILALLDRVENHGGYHTARCPAHDDNRASLSISEADDGRVLLKCHANCLTEAVVAALGLTMADLFPPREDAKPGRAPGKAQPVRFYDYVDDTGELLYQVVRYEPKDFRQRRPARPGEQSKDGWVWNLKDVKRVLYDLPGIRKAIDEERWVLVVEGEKDANNLRRLGFCATTNAGGADKWMADYTKTLAGAHVVILPDNDEPGSKHALRVAREVKRKVKSVRIVELPDLPYKGDVSDWLRKGNSADELEALIDSTPEWEPKRPTILPATDSPQRADASDIPAPASRDDKGNPEYDPCQIAQMLGLETESAVSNRALGYRAAQRLKDRLQYSPKLGWIWWEGRHWERDEKPYPSACLLFASLSSVVRDEAATLYEFTSRLARVGRQSDSFAMSRVARSHLKHVKMVESQSFCKDSMVLAGAAFRVDPEQFDIKPWVIGFENTVWDRGTTRPHRQDDYMLSLCPVEYDPGADRSEWDAVLERMTGGDKDFARTLQDIAGYCLSGGSHLRLIPWLYGPKGTGKSTFVELLQTMLGEQSSSIDPTKLKGEEAERLGVLLWNKRIAICEEAGNKYLDTETLKAISGSSRYPVRYLHHEQFKALPTHVLLMVANDAPSMPPNDEALKDRVLALPFDHPLAAGEPLRFSGGLRIEEVRKNPRSKLVAGFVAWAVEGLQRVFDTQNIFKAKCTISATRKFWADTDPLTDFWENWRYVETQTDDRGKPIQVETQTPLSMLLRQGIARSDLRIQYEIWARREGHKKYLSPQRWTSACRDHGLYEDNSDKHVRKWKLFELVTIPASDTSDTSKPFSTLLREEEKTLIEQSEKHPRSVGSVGKISAEEDPWDPGEEPDQGAPEGPEEDPGANAGSVTDEDLFGSGPADPFDDFYLEDPFAGEDDG